MLPDSFRFIFRNNRVCLRSVTPFRVRVSGVTISAGEHSSCTHWSCTCIQSGQSLTAREASIYHGPLPSTSTFSREMLFHWPTQPLAWYLHRNTTYNNSSPLFEDHCSWSSDQRWISNRNRPDALRQGQKCSLLDHYKQSIRVRTDHLQHDQSYNQFAHYVTAVILVFLKKELLSCSEIISD